MQAKETNSLPTIRQLSNKILSSRRITRQDQSQLMRLLSHSGLGEREQDLVDRIYQELHMGLIRVVD